jgi:hypothetical protein
MNKLTIGAAVTAGTAMVLTALAPSLAARAAVYPVDQVRLPVVTTTMTKAGFTVSGNTTLRAGRIEIKAIAKGTGNATAIASYRHGYSFAHARADEKYVATHQTKTGLTKEALKRLHRYINDTTLYGGLDAAPNHPSTETVVLPGGRYTIFDSAGNLPTHPVVLTVTGRVQSRSGPSATATVVFKPGMRFGGSSTLPAHGTIKVKNVSMRHEDHFLLLQQVKPNTTRRQVKNYLASGSYRPAAFMLSGQTGTDGLSPGLSQTFTYSTPKGRYLEICYFPDYQTGEPHADMGMYRLVTLR